MEPVILGLTHPGHLEELARRVASGPRRRPLRALVNNAGIGLNAPVETLPLDVWLLRGEVRPGGGQRLAAPRGCAPRGASRRGARRRAHEDEQQRHRHDQAADRTRYTIGRDAAMFTFFARILPDRMPDWILARELRPHYADKPSSRTRTSQARESPSGIARGVQADAQDARRCGTRASGRQRLQAGWTVGIIAPAFAVRARQWISRPQEPEGHGHIADAVSRR